MRPNSKSVSGAVCLYRMSEPEPKSTQGVYLGKTSIYKMPFYLDGQSLLNPHIAIIGMSGSGKSYFLKSFAAKSVIHNRARMLTIDWNDEYRELVEFLSGETLSFGKDFKINVMETYSNALGGASNVTELIDSMIGLEQAQKANLNGIILELFAEGGQRNLKSLISKARMEDHALASRLLQLDGNPFFADRTEFDMGKVLDGVYSINLSGIRDSSQRAELVRFVLRLVIDCMHRMEIGSGEQRILVLDESWRLLKNSDEVGILYREGRKYGISVVSATQMASDINNEIVANSGCLAVFKLQSEQDYAILEGTGIIDTAGRAVLGSFGTGGCMLCLAPKAGASGSSRFCIERISGMEFGRIRISGGSMKHEISYAKFLGVTDLLDRGLLRDKITSFVLQNRKSIDVPSFVRFLTKAGMDRPAIVCYLRELGLDDLTIVSSYEKA